ncbi:hypothetical protein QJS10_CPB15g02161 [Acorus calamus]|uniref:Phytocyanin domain-containing protein n=1 Tax=Acorus calamus TaxID=4465 RepID=A0AAV9D6Z8_ACOCL|nr:hypothetical protein QJS10_CPB15g02161 [Acorus calamus]
MNANNSLDSGNDAITLKTAGNKWYICATPGHCDLGQKLMINVISSGMSPIGSPAPAPTPTVTSNGPWWRRSPMLRWH